MKIWKYPLVHKSQVITTPFAWKPIHVEHQDGIVTLWAETELTRGMDVDREVIVVGTGQEVDIDDYTYIGTTVSEDGQFVWHVYWDADEE